MGQTSEPNPIARKQREENYRSLRDSLVLLFWYIQGYAREYFQIQSDEECGGDAWLMNVIQDVAEEVVEDFLFQIVKLGYDPVQYMASVDPAPLAEEFVSSEGFEDGIHEHLGDWD